MKTPWIIIAAATLALSGGCVKMQITQHDMPWGGTKTTVSGSWHELTIYTEKPSAVMIEAE